MATNKTIQPTNVTVQIPEMSDKPDQSKNSNCIDKIIDGVNSLNSNLSIIGTVVLGTATGYVSVPSSTTPTEIGSITLQKGTWIIIGCCDWASDANGYRQIAFGSALNPGRETATTSMGTSSKETYQQVILIATYSESTTQKLYAAQNSGSSLNAYPLIRAIRIA